jgi:hypothetical protein
MTSVLPVSKIPIDIQNPDGTNLPLSLSEP